MNQSEVIIPRVCSVSGTRPDSALEESINVSVVIKLEATPNLEIQDNDDIKLLKLYFDIHLLRLGCSWRRYYHLSLTAA
jgi:hypothetical protein